jgi:hypothetical protein
VGQVKIDSKIKPEKKDNAMEEDDEGVLEEMPLKNIIPTSKLFLYKVMLKKVRISQSPVVCSMHLFRLFIF